MLRSRPPRRWGGRGFSLTSTHYLPELRQPTLRISPNGLQLEVPFYVQEHHRGGLRRLCLQHQCPSIFDHLVRVVHVQHVDGTGAFLDRMSNRVRIEHELHGIALYQTPFCAHPRSSS